MPATKTPRRPKSADQIARDLARQRGYEMMVDRSPIDELTERAALRSAIIAERGYDGLLTDEGRQEREQAIKAALTPPLMDAWRELISDDCANTAVDELMAFRLGLAVGEMLVRGEIAWR